MFVTNKKYMKNVFFPKSIRGVNPQKPPDYATVFPIDKAVHTRTSLSIMSNRRSIKLDGPA